MEYIILGVVLINTLFLIGIAGSVAKLISYNQGEQSTRDEWTQIIKNRQTLDSQNRPPNYGDPQLISEDVPAHWDGIPKISRNWDGLPSEEE